MKTKLLEFKNSKGQNIRGIATIPDGEIKEIIICLHGFERCTTTEKKFKIMADNLTNEMFVTFRLDFSGCGLSDGDFRFTTIEGQGEDLIKTIEELNKKIGNYNISFIAHSLGACVLANQISKIKNIDKTILIAPALNQKDLLRYWFVISQMKKQNPSIEITWQNYKEYLNEDDFIKDCKRIDKITKANYIEANYFLQCKDIDFSNKFDGKDILHIHGLKDIAVPKESLNVNFENKIFIEDGDHDLEKPNHMDIWLHKSIEFLKGKAY